MWGGEWKEDVLAEAMGRRAGFLELPDCLAKASQDFQRQKGLRKK